MEEKTRETSKEDHANAENSDSNSIERDELPTKRMRTRSMDAAEEDNLYAMSKYRISPETIGILNSKGITQLFPIQVGYWCFCHLGVNIRRCFRWKGFNWSCSHRPR